jgi:hypothetical protein
MLLVEEGSQMSARVWVISWRQGEPLGVFGDLNDACMHAKHWSEQLLFRPRVLEVWETALFHGQTGVTAAGDLRARYRCGRRIEGVHVGHGRSTEEEV